MTLRELRLARGYSMRQLASITGIDLGSLWRYETGRMRPKATNEEKLAKALRISVRRLREVLDNTTTA